MTKAAEYVYIRVWGQYLYSYAYYIAAQQDEALETDAPINAIFRREDGTWATADKIGSDDLRKIIESNAEFIRAAMQ